MILAHVYMDALGFPGAAAMPLDQLRLAVAGLAGICGFLLCPAVMSWLRLLIEFLEWSRPGLTRPKRISGLQAVRAMSLSMSLLFFVITWFRAARELRDVQAEAPVVGPSVQGLLVGVAMWAGYAVLFSIVRRDTVRRLNARKVGAPLR